MAYAPVLEDFGIDQTAFLKFLHDFNQSSEARLFSHCLPRGMNLTGFPGVPVFGCRQLGRLWRRICAWHCTHCRFYGCAVREEDTDRQAVSSLLRQPSISCVKETH